MCPTHGIQILIRSSCNRLRIWMCSAFQRKRGLFNRFKRRKQIFLTGHPEYDTDTLLQEYERDIERNLSNVEAPKHYFAPGGKNLLTAGKLMQRYCL